MSELSSEPISALLAKWQAGDEEAFRALVPQLYKELRRLAHYPPRNRAALTSSAITLSAAIAGLVRRA